MEETIELNCNVYLQEGFELAIKQLGYVIIDSTSSECGMYINYIVSKSD